MLTVSILRPQRPATICCCLLRQRPTQPRTAALPLAAAPTLRTAHKPCEQQHTRAHAQATHTPEVSHWQPRLRVGKRVSCLCRCCRCSRGGCCARCACADLARLHVCAWAGAGESLAPLCPASEDCAAGIGRRGAAPLCAVAANLQEATGGTDVRGRQSGAVSVRMGCA